jgi:predicted Zn-dependent protease
VRRVYQAARQVEAQKRVAVFVLAAEEALKVDDVIGAANNYRLALQNGDNPTIRAKLEEVDERAKARRFELSLTRARAAERDKKWAEAAFEFSEYAVSKAPKNADYRLTLADLYLAANLVERAAGETDRALSLAPNDPRAKALSAAVKKRRR